MMSEVWPSSRDFVEGVQNPALCFLDPELKATAPALDRLGMPLVAAGQFAYVFKLNSPNGARAEAVRCFRGYLRDRAQRYEAINHHLDTVSISALASFEYDEQGVLINGRKFPILVMEWIDGNALDVYISKVLNNSEAIKFVAERWIEVISSLRKANIAHGDLQHGNVIVQGDSLLRLVDLDGMFVPAMRGWRASELGHPHYQHPKRAGDHFNENLDNFSALTIYVSLLAIAEQPALWQEHHDENLILSKADFLDPSGSKVFKKLRKLTTHTRRLAESLEQACQRGPLDCPDLLTLVAPPSRLPAWMRTGPQVTVQTSTREASRSIPNVPVPVSSTQPKPQATSGVVTSAAVPFHGALQPVTSSSKIARKAARNGLTYAFIGAFFVWLWLPLTRTVLQGWGVDPWTSSSAGIVAFLVMCGLVGYRRAALELAPAKLRIPIPIITVPSTTPRPLPSGARSSVGNAVYVGHRVNRVFHYQSCEWARKISFRNRMPVGSSADARTRGFRPCKICRP